MIDQSILFNFSTIGSDAFRSSYREYSNSSSRVSFDNPTSKIGGQYVFGLIETLPMEKAIEIINNNYNLQSFQIKTFHSEGPTHCCIIYLLVANLGKNKSLIKADMARMGYSIVTERDFLALGMKWSQLQFESSGEHKDA